MGSGEGDAPREGAGRGALSVAAGIFASRVAGLVRVSATAAAFGVSPLADVFQVALRAPNALQNLLGEQALSASFIPVYSRLLASGDKEGARRLAGAAFGLLAATVSLLVLVGVAAARPIVAFFSPGYLLDAATADGGSRFELAVGAVRWIFPMTGLLVLSAWALGVLNSHRKFFLPYVAPVFWNLAIIGALFAARWTAPAGLGAAGLGERLLTGACVGALIGGLLQLAVQLPAAIRAIGGLRPELSLSAPGVRPALAALGPALAGRGAVQLSAYLDLILASFLAAGSQGALGYAQQLYLLPISLFGQSVAASALPEMARATTRENSSELAARTRQLLGGLRLLIVPTTVLFLILGRDVVGGLYRLLPGRFGTGDVAFVALILALYALGLPASSSSRLLQSTFFALGDTGRPARIAAGRVALSAALSVPLMLLLDRIHLATLADLPGLAGLAGLDRDPALGAAGLALAATAGAWFERFRLGSILRARIGVHDDLGVTSWRCLAAALLAALPAAGAGIALAAVHPTLRAAGVVSLFAAGYLVAGLAFGLPGLKEIVSRFRRRP